MFAGELMFLAVVLFAVAWRCWSNLRMTQLKFWKAVWKTAWELMRIVGVICVAFTIGCGALLCMGTMTFFEAWTTVLSIAIHGVAWSWALAVVFTFPLVFVRHLVARVRAGM